MDSAHPNESKYKLVRKRHSQLMLNKIQTFWKNDEFTDVSLMTKEGNIIKAHKLVLAACSEHFAKIFRDLPQQNQNPIIIVCGGEHFDPIENLVKLMYTGETDLSANRLYTVRQACSHVGMNNVETLKCVPSTELHNFRRDVVSSEVQGEVATAPAVPTPSKRKKGPRVKVIHDFHAQNKQNPSQQTLPNPNEPRADDSDHVESPLNLSVFKTKDADTMLVCDGQGDQNLLTSGPSLFGKVPSSANLNENSGSVIEGETLALHDTISTTNPSVSTKTDVINTSEPCAPRFTTIKQEIMDFQESVNTQKIMETGLSISMVPVPMRSGHETLTPSTEASSPSVQSKLEFANDISSSVAATEPKETITRETRDEKPMITSNINMTPHILSPVPSRSLAGGNNDDTLLPLPESHSLTQEPAHQDTVSSIAASGKRSSLSSSPAIVTGCSEINSSGMTKSANTVECQSPGRLTPPISSNKLASAETSKIKQSLAKLKSISFTAVTMNSSKGQPKSKEFGFKRTIKSKTKPHASKKFAYDPAFYPNLSSLTTKLQMNSGQYPAGKKKYKAPNPPGFSTCNKPTPSTSKAAFMPPQERVVKPKPKPRTATATFTSLNSILSVPRSMLVPISASSSTASESGTNKLNDRKNVGFTLSNNSSPNCGISQGPSQFLAPITSNKQSANLSALRSDGYAIGDKNESDGTTRPSSANSNITIQSQPNGPVPRVRRIGQFECSFCDKKFVHQASLKDHMNLHFRLLTCPVCQKAFTHEGHLFRHLSKESCDVKKIK